MTIIVDARTTSFIHQEIQVLICHQIYYLKSVCELLACAAMLAIAAPLLIYLVCTSSFYTFYFIPTLSIFVILQLLFPTNHNFLDSSTEKGKVLDQLKFDVSDINHHQA